MTTLILVLNYFSLLPYSKFDEFVDIDKLCIAIAVFCLLWLFFGIYTILISTTFAENWIKIEKKTKEKQEEQKGEYEKAYISYHDTTTQTEQTLIDLNEKKDIIQYFLIR